MTSATRSSTDLAPAGPSQQQRGIRLPQLLLSLLVVAVFALLAVWWQASTTSRIPVLALATDVEQGQPVTADQLTEIYISTDVPANVQGSEQRQVFIGARPVSDLSAGTLITTDMFVGGAELVAGQAFVGLVLDSSRAPLGIVAGDRVQIVGPGRSGEEVDLISENALVENARYEDGGVVLRLRLDVQSAQRAQLQADQVVVVEIESDAIAEWESGGES